MTRRGLLAMGSVGFAAADGARSAPSAQVADQSFLEQLGEGPNTRMLMIHADDLGMCHSVNDASIHALTQGIVSSGSVMVPCPWFPEIAAWSRENPTADLGLHLTLTSEWKYYRWRPVSPVAQVKGLVDAEGYLWRSVEEVVAHSTPREVELEIRAQIKRAREFGMKPTHVDSHMGTLFAHAGFFDAYVRVAREERILPMLMQPSPEMLTTARAIGIDYAPLARRLHGQGFVLLDRLVTSLQGDTIAERRSRFREFVEGLRPGVTELIVHLARDGEEIRNISYSWRNRVNEHSLFTDPEMRVFLQKQGVKLVGYRPLAALWQRT